MMPGISGYEDDVAMLIAGLKPPELPHKRDAMGNFVVTLAGGDTGDEAAGDAGEPAVLFVAHMDEIGFLVTDVRDDGFVRLKSIGGIDPRTVFGREVRIVTETCELTGVVAVKPPHLMKDRSAEMGRVPDVDELLVDIGAQSREEAEQMGLDTLDFAVLEKHPTVLNGTYLCSRALDDRAGCWVLLKAMERLAADPPPGTVHFAFSVQEEIGLRGAEALAVSYPDIAVAFAVDSVSTADWPDVDRALSPAVLGGGPCLRVVDNATIVPVSFRRELQELAAEEGIPLQTVFSGGGTDAKPFQRQGPHVIPLAFPLRYTHSAVELVDRRDLDHLIDLVCAAAHKYASPATER